MKKVLFAALIFLLASCHVCKESPPVIVWKSYSTYMNNKLPDCICRYGYTVNRGFSVQEFDDSCWKYNVRDTIKSSIK